MTLGDRNKELEMQYSRILINSIYFRHKFEKVPGPNHSTQAYLLVCRAQGKASAGSQVRPLDLLVSPLPPHFRVVTDGVEVAHANLNIIRHCCYWDWVSERLSDTYCPWISQLCRRLLKPHP